LEKDQEEWGIRARRKFTRTKNLNNARKESKTRIVVEAKIIENKLNENENIIYFSRARILSSYNPAGASEGASNTVFGAAAVVRSKTAFFF
jgi:hypothetical protein